jgi:hypothetical protein
VCFGPWINQPSSATRQNQDANFQNVTPFQMAMGALQYLSEQYDAPQSHHLSICNGRHLSKSHGGSEK